MFLSLVMSMFMTNAVEAPTTAQVREWLNEVPSTKEFEIGTAVGKAPLKYQMELGTPVREEVEFRESLGEFVWTDHILLNRSNSWIQLKEATIPLSCIVVRGSKKVGEGLHADYVLDLTLFETAGPCGEEENYYSNSLLSFVYRSHGEKNIYVAKLKHMRNFFEALPVE